MASRLCGSPPPSIDGVLEPVWQDAATGRAFSALPAGDPAKAQTETYVGFDDEALYVAFRCAEPDMPGLIGNVPQHDGPLWEDDCVEIFLDVNGDRATYVQFVVNVIGTTFEQACGAGDGQRISHRWAGAYGFTGRLPHACRRHTVHRTLTMVPNRCGNHYLTTWRR